MSNATPSALAWWSTSRDYSWSSWLGEPIDEVALAQLRVNINTGWPTGSPEFIGNFEAQLGRSLVRQRPGRKPKLL